MPDEMDEIVELQIRREEQLTKLFAEQRQELGLDNDTTLTTFFELFDMLIQLYRLNKAMEILPEVVPICRKRGETWHIKGVQALAFTKWKLGLFREALELFHEQEGLCGPNAALFENMGHTYNSIGDYPKASEYFHKALDCFDAEAGRGRHQGDKGGTLLGLGIIEERLGQFEKALASTREAQRLFREKANGKPSSLIAKAGSSIAKALLKLADKEVDADKKVDLENQAIEHELENVQLFIVTAGIDSPLTASSHFGLGTALLRRERIDEAIDAFANSYKYEAIKDAFDLTQIVRVHQALFQAHLDNIRNGAALDRKAFRSYVPIVDGVLMRVRLGKQDANAGVYYKCAAEVMAYAEEHSVASSLLGEVIELFTGEDPKLVGKLLSQAKDLKAFCDKHVPAARDLVNEKAISVATGETEAHENLETDAKSKK